MMRPFSWLLVLALLGAQSACSSEDPVDTDTSNSSDDDSADDDSSDDDTSDDDTGDDDTGDDDAPVIDAGTGGGKRDAAAADGGGKRPIDGSTAVVDARVAPKDDGAVKADAQQVDAAGPNEDPDRPRPKCVAKDSQVIVIGDSYINWPATHTFPEDMAQESGQKWRMEAVGGYSMATGGTGLIPPLFDRSISRDPDAHTVLMDGGGNDILLGDSLRQCRDDKAPTVAACQKIVTDALEAARKLMDRMAEKGIRDVVYFFYPHVPKNTLLGGPDPNHILDYSLPKTKELCDEAETRTEGKLRCHFVDMIPVFEGKPEAQWFFPGDIHPTSTGSKAMAKAVWGKMTEECVAQKESSGCCEP